MRFVCSEGEFSVVLMTVSTEEINDTTQVGSGHIEYSSMLIRSESHLLIYQVKFPAISLSTM